MLLYNVSYLAYTQSVDVPLNQVGDVLSNLWSVCCSTELGRQAFFPSSLLAMYPLVTDVETAYRKSHETTSTLVPPTPLAFALDFAQLLQATMANPSRRSKVGRAVSDRLNGATGEERKDKEVGREEMIMEMDGEEEGWDLVET
jgi:hypothetical protein